MADFRDLINVIKQLGPPQAAVIIRVQRAVTAPENASVADLFVALVVTVNEILGGDDDMVSVSILDSLGAALDRRMTVPVN